MTGDISMETANYRYYRRMAWQLLRSRYAAAVADRIEEDASEADARKAAARSVRGDTRALMSELLTHAPVSAVITFLGAAQEWGDGGERLLEQEGAVLALVDTIEPRPSWRSPEALSREMAEDDARWGVWVQAWLSLFRATGPEAAAAVSQSPASPPPTNESQTSAPPTSAGLQKWAPLLYSAVAVVGTTAVVVFMTRK